MFIDYVRQYNDGITIDDDTDSYLEVGNNIQ